MITIRTAAALLLLGVLISGCNEGAAENESTDPPDPVVSVRTASVRQRTMPVTVIVNGLTDVLDRESVTAPIDGTIVSLMAEVGTAVDIGDTIAVLRTRDSQAAIAGAQRLLETAETPEQRAQAQRAMAVARDAVQLVPIVAGHRGVVVSRSASSGQAVTAETRLFGLVDLNTLDFVASVPLADLARVRPGQIAHISFPSLPNRDFAGRVASISAQSDLQSQAAPVRLQFSERPQALQSQLRVGMAGTASITVGAHPDVMVVPPAALLRDDLTNTYTLYKVGPDSLAHRMPVTVGVMADSLAEVAGTTLHVGDDVIVAGNYEVSDSTRVSVRLKGSR